MSSRKRVLIVVSSFDPAMTADMQRARMLAWDLPRFGWDVEILTPGLAYQNPATIDTRTSGLFPADLVVHDVSSWFARVFAAMGIGSIGIRSFVPSYRRGLEVLAGKRFDLVYFSTTHFPLFCLGPLWRKRTGVPYVLDYQDPWTGAAATYKTTRSSFKRTLARWVSRRLEHIAIRPASAFVAVSARYLHDLHDKYARLNPRLEDARWTVTIPFGARIEDFHVVQSGSQPPADRKDQVKLVYVGAGGPNLALSFETICSAIARLRARGMPEAAAARIFLTGTILGWRPGDPKFLHDTAARSSLADAVTEDPIRVEYVKSMELLMNSDGALVLGVDDEGYIPSKFFSYALSGKPVVACFHVRSDAYLKFSASGAAGHVIGFDPGGGPVPNPDEAVATFLKEAARGLRFDRAAAIEGFLSPRMAQRHAELFDEIVRDGRGPSE